MGTVGRQDLAKLLAKRVGLTQAKTRSVLDELFSVIADELASGHRVSVQGFGSWNTKVHSPRTARNPRNGRPLEVPARTKVTFRPGTGLRDKVETSIDPEIYFGEGVARATEVDSLLCNLFDAEPQDLDLEKLRERIRDVIGAAAQREAEEFFRELCPDPDVAEILGPAAKLPTESPSGS